jgi:hypothetical protein
MPASSVARLAPALADSPFRVVQVEALGDDATVVIVRDGDALIPASCVSSYATRTVGEWVIVARVLEGLHVLGAVAAEPPPAVEVDLPPTVTVTYSTSPPGAGWESVSALYVRDDGAGARSLHAVIAAASTPTVKAPAPVTLTSTASRGYQSTTYTSETPKAGSWSSADWSGLWLIPGIAAACAGKTVTGMTLTVSRAGTSHGRPTAPVRLGLHARTTLGKPTLTDQWHATLADGSHAVLPRGGRATVVIPAAQRAALASGAAKGVGVYGSGQSDYCIYGSTATLKITFGV